MLQYAPNFYYYMPDNYYNYAQGSMVQIKYNAPSFELPNTDNLKTDFYANSFQNNTHIQLAGVGITYKGSLLQMRSNIPEVYFGFSQNLVEDNVFYGEGTRLIEISGPVMNI